MKIRMYFELSTRDKAGAIADTFRLAMTIEESDREFDYKELTASTYKEGVLRVTGLDGIVRPEDVKIITPEEYDEKYGGDHEEGTL